jgi:hypothetical protein
MSRAYVIVADLVGKRVVRVAESPPVTALNMDSIAASVRDLWYTVSREYPAPDYDVLTATDDNIKSVRQSLPALEGWELVSIELLDP